MSPARYDGSSELSPTTACAAAEQKFNEYVHSLVRDVINKYATQYGYRGGLRQELIAGDCYWHLSSESIRRLIASGWNIEVLCQKPARILIEPRDMMQEGEFSPSVALQQGEAMYQSKVHEIVEQILTAACRLKGAGEIHAKNVLPGYWQHLFLAALRSVPVLGPEITHLRSEQECWNEFSVALPDSLACP